MFFAKSGIFSIPETKVAHSFHVFAKSRQNEESFELAVSEKTF